MSGALEHALSAVFQTAQPRCKRKICARARNSASAGNSVPMDRREKFRSTGVDTGRSLQFTRWNPGLELAALRFTMKALRALGCASLAVTWALACVEAGEENTASRWGACEINSNCVIASTTCCGPCGSSTVDDVVGVNKARADEYRKVVCPNPVACPACPTERNPDLLATCAAGSCKALDVRQHAASACTKDSECRLRVASCCECGGSVAPSDLIAVSQEALYADLVCDPMTGCPACAPIYPTNVEAGCAIDGHCEVRPALPARCLLAFDPGPCKAAMKVFAFVDGACVERAYGGCEGNDNRFLTLEECMAVCEARPNPNGCPAGRISRTVCLSCGPAGGCGSQAEVCAKTCQTNSDCEGPLWYCSNGACEAGGCI